MKVVLWNCCGVASSPNKEVYYCKLDAVLKIFGSSDVILLQEIHLEGWNDHMIFHLSQYDMFGAGSFLNSASCEVMVLVKKFLDPVVKWVCPIGRGCAVEINWNGNRVVVGSLYAPADHTNKINWFDSCNLKASRSLVGGDFNMPLQKKRLQEYCM